MNKLIIIGNLTRDPEMATTPGGKAVCTFTVAVNRRSGGDHPEATYFRVAAWEQLAERCAQYLAKGKKVCCVGSVEARAYTTNQGAIRASLEMQAREVEFLTPRQDSAQAAAPAAQESMTPVECDDVPF